MNKFTLMIVYLTSIVAKVTSAVLVTKINFSSSETKKGIIQKSGTKPEIKFTKQDHQSNNNQQTHSSLLCSEIIVPKS